VVLHEVGLYEEYNIPDETRNSCYEKSAKDIDNTTNKKDYSEFKGIAHNQLENPYCRGEVIFP